MTTPIVQDGLCNHANDAPAVSESNLQRSGFFNEKPNEANSCIQTPIPGSPATARTSESGAEESDSKYLSGPRLWLILFALSLVIILGGLDFSIVGVAVPAITERFHTIADVAWYGVSYRLTACVFQFAWGQVYTIFSTRWSLAVSIVIFLVGSAVSAAAESSVVLIIGRSITGIGSAGVLGGLFTAIMIIAPLRMRPILTSVISALEAVAMVVGPVVGGLLTQHASWRWCFWINLPIGGLALAGIVLFMVDDAGATEKEKLSWKQILAKMDIIANTFLFGCLTSLFMVLSWAGIKYDWSSGTVIGLLVTFGVCLGAFAYIQYRKGDEATLPPRIMKSRSVLAGAFFSFMLNGVSGITEYYIPIYFQAVRSWSSGKAGLMMLPISIGFNIGLLLQGFLTTWLGYYTPFMIAAAVITPIGVGLITTWTVTTSFARLIVYTGMIGFGGGLGFEVPQIAVQTVLPEKDGPMGLSVTLFAQNFGGSLFISVAQQIFTSRLLSDFKDKVPGLDAAAIQGLGLTSSTVGSANNSTSSNEIKLGIEDSFLQIWYSALALSCLMIVGALLTEWRSVKDVDEADAEKA